LVLRFQRSAALEIDGIRLQVVGGRLHQHCLLFPEQLDPKRVSDGARDLVLNGEHVLRVPIVGVGPEQVPVGHIDQLRREPEPPAGAADAALEHGADLEPLADRPDVFELALERKDRCSRYHVQPADLRQRVDQLVGHAIGEVLVVRVGAQVGKGEHRNGLLDHGPGGHGGQVFGGKRQVSGAKPFRQCAGRGKAVGR
jgi:hypothetical protein